MQAPRLARPAAAIRLDIGDTEQWGRCGVVIACEGLDLPVFLTKKGYQATLGILTASGQSVYSSPDAACLFVAPRSLNRDLQARCLGSDAMVDDG